MSDAVGDRLLMFDNTGGPSLELLRLSPALVARPGFEHALRSRVELLAHFVHASFPKVHAVEHLGAGDGLTLVSTHVEGKRLSDVVGGVRDMNFVAHLIDQVVPALTSLQQVGRGVAHGTLTADRIVLTMDGRLHVIEHVLGPAIEHLQLPADELWRRFGIAAIPLGDAPSALDGRTDVLQLALIALSILVGRHLGPDEYPDRLAELFDAQVERGMTPLLRQWLGRALRLQGRPFESAHDAQTAFQELSLEEAPPAAALTGTAESTSAAEFITPQPHVAPAETELKRRIVDRLPPIPEVLAPLLATGPVNVAGVEDVAPTWFAPASDEDNSPGAIQDIQNIQELQDIRDIQDEQPVAEPWMRRQIRSGVLTAPLLGIALVEACVIGYLVLNRAAPAPPAPSAGADVVIDSPERGAQVLVDGQLAGLTPVQLRVGSATRSIRVEAGEPPPLSAMAIDKPGDRNPLQLQPMLDGRGRASSPVAAVRTGGIRVVTPVELQIVEGDRVLGSSSDGAVVLSAGRHELQLLNSSLGYRTNHVVDIKAGVIGSLRIPQPTGLMNVNAIPWAEVWIDGKRIGETPLANLTLPLGDHEVVFRHPALGEQRRTATLRADSLVRLSADLR